MILRRLLSILLCGGLITGLTSFAMADEEWWEDSPYYEEEAWYDVTEWFDGNDYQYVEPSERDYDYDETYEGYDYDPTYGYDADPDYYTGYGYDDRYGADDWFYDYWDGGYAYYRDYNDDGIYDRSYTYYDYDDDGFYDAYFIYEDWNGDGIYDDVDYYSFVDSDDENQTSAEENRVSQEKQGMQDKKQESSKREMVRGEVLRTKKTTVRDTKHLIAEIEKSDGKKCLVDLGPANKIQEDVSEGDQISVRGPISKAGEKRILIAQQVKLDGQDSHDINRSPQEFKGRVADTRTAQIRGNKHMFVILASSKEKEDGGKKRLVDLGESDQIDFDLQQGDQITVTAAPVKINDRIVLIADSIRCEGKECQLEHGDQEQKKQEGSEREAKKQIRPHSLTGQVQKTREITVRGQDRYVAIVQAENGDRVLVDLGPAGQFDEHIRNGDRITVRGPLVKSNDKRVLLARSLKRAGEQIDLGRRGTSPSDASQQTIRGEITSTRKATVRGKRRQLAKVETDDGNSVVVDLGPPTELDIKLSQGDQLVASGALVKAGKQTVLIAYEVEDQDGASVAIKRRGSQMTR